MKIFISISQLTGGGAEHVAIMWSEGLANRGHDVSILTSKNRKADYQCPKGVNIINGFAFGTLKPLNKASIFIHNILPFIWNIYRMICEWFSTIKTQHRLIIKEKPDVIIGVMPPNSFIAWLASINTKCLVISTDHDAFERPYNSPMPLMTMIYKFYINKIYKCVTILTEADKKFIGNRLNNIVVMPNPLAYKPVKNLSTKKKRIVAAGRLNDWHCKGFDNLIIAWSKIAHKYPEWILDIAGKGNDNSKKFLLDLSRKHNISDKVIFSGFHNDMARFFQDASIFVLSSRYEGFGLVLIEAMSQGCACIACDYKGRQKEIIRNENEGICIDTDNIDNLAFSIKKLIDNETLRSNIQENAIERAAYYQLDNISRMWEELLIRLTNES